ncbi:MAG: copper amine oxidase N-terminal domain-containing protein [Bacillota bacterium]|nr:copper amine oxidase N-terminal domain-containing protein [Eubacteriales bacterium]
MLRQKRFFLLVVLVSILLLALPGLATASESTLYYATAVTTVSTPQHSAVNLGSLVIVFDPITEGEHRALLSVPSGYTIMVPAVVQSVEDPHLNLSTSITGQANEFRVSINYEGRPQKRTFTVPFYTRIPSNATGDIQVSIDGMQGQFTDGTVTIGRIAGGNVSFASSETAMRTVKPETEIPYSLEVAEDTSNILRAGQGTLVFSLPKGLEWQPGIQIDVVRNGGFLPVPRLDSGNPRILLIDIEEQGVRSKGAFIMSGALKSERALGTGTEIKAEADGVDLTRGITLVLARVIAPQNEARFTVGRDWYLSNGRTLSMDVLPYTKEGRLFLPLRYVGLSMGVEPDNIKWNGSVATLVLGDKNVQVRPGSRQLVVNGSSIEMDVAAEFSQGRVMLPYRFIAEAFGASVDWDSSTRTVTMEL